MVLDGPDDLEQLQSPPGLKESVLHADEVLRNTKEIRVTSRLEPTLSTRGEFSGNRPIMDLPSLGALITGMQACSHVSQ